MPVKLEYYQTMWAYENLQISGRNFESVLLTLNIY